MLPPARADRQIDSICLEQKDSEAMVKFELLNPSAGMDNERIL